MPLYRNMQALDELYCGMAPRPPPAIFRQIYPGMKKRALSEFGSSFEETIWIVHVVGMRQLTVLNHRRRIER